MRYAFFAAAICLLSACSKHTELDSAVSKLTFKTLSGISIPLAERDGPTLINFWSTSCAVCIHELPELAEVYSDYREQGFEFIAVAMPYDPPNHVLEFANEAQFPFPIAIDLKGEAVDAFNSVIGTPTSYLLDEDGKLVMRFVGAIDLVKLRDQLSELMRTS